jgi:predicted ATPase
MLNSLEIKNLLSFGPEGVKVTLRPLNVLIGPNGSGKSNFLTAIRILQNLSGNIQSVWNDANRAEDWFWANSDNYIELSVDSDLLSYHVSFYQEYSNIVFEYENIKTFDGLSLSTSQPKDIDDIFLPVKDNKKSIFAQQSPSNSNIINFYNIISNLVIYYDKPHGNNTALKLPQLSDNESSFLSDQFDNLAIVLHELNTKMNIEALLLENFQKYYPRAQRIYMGLTGGRPQVFIQELVGNRLVNIPAPRLSDGTLYFLCLLTILMHPTPPPLICIDEPEVGLHPDILPLVAELLVEASKRTQIIITTHSDLLVSAIGKRDIEAILVCDHTPEKGTSMTRPDPEKLKKWLAESEESLGDLWLRGAIGGTLY